MKYEEKTAQNPVNSDSCVPGTKTKIGTVKASDLHRFRDTCQSIPVPGPQLNLNGSRMDKSRPLRRCTEWTEEAVAALIGAGILQP